VITILESGSNLFVYVLVLEKKMCIINSINFKNADDGSSTYGFY